MNTAFAYKTSLVLTSLFNPRKVEQHKHALRQLAADLDIVQNRLGTDKERPEDCDLARELGHEIRNKLHIVSLWESLGFTEMPAEIRHRIPRRRTEVNSFSPTLPVQVAVSRS